MIRRVVEHIVGRIKGSDYKLDPDLPFSALVSLLTRRGFGLLRCLLFGVKFSFDIRDLVFVGKRVKLVNCGSISFGRGVTLGDGVVVDGLSRKGVVFGDGVNIGPYTIIEATGVVSNIGEGFSIGNRSGMGAFSFVGAAGGVWIGDDVIMGQRVSFHSENHIFESIDVPIRLQGVFRQGIRVEDDCWVGANVVFLDGAHLGRGCVVAAGSVVRGVIAPFSVIGGVPAKLIRSRVVDRR
ncbi:MAG: acyltransferase [Denitromonas halophila]|nr:MAG: acyltransferase [Denitromonas halophila]